MNKVIETLILTQAATTFAAILQTLPKATRKQVKAPCLKAFQALKLAFAGDKDFE